MKRKLFAGLCRLAGTGLAVYSGVLRGRALAPAPDLIVTPGRQVPALEVVNAQGESLNLAAAARGRKRVIVFYALSCGRCETVLPELQPFPPEIRLYLVQTGSNKASKAPEHSGFDHAELFFDRNGVFRRSFAMPALPTILFVDEKGILRDGLAGPHSRGLVQKKLNELAAMNSEEP